MVPSFFPVQPKTICSLNFSCMFVELIYGVISNSLGLISDSVHMFFDCSALVLTLVASYFASLPPNKQFQYGFGRIEVISGFTNCMFLVFVASSIVLESLERLISPQEIIADQLLTVAIIGLLVNVAGIFLLINPEEEEEDNDDQTQPKEMKPFPFVSKEGYEAIPKSEELTEITVVTSASSPTNASTAAAAALEIPSKRQMKRRKPAEKSKNENLAGLFLHITSDALGSVGVIVSAVCIKYYGMKMADPICSLGISALIVASIVSLLKSTVTTLTMGLSETAGKKMDKIGMEVLGMTNVADCEEFKVWVYRRNELAVTMKLVAENGAQKEQLMTEIRSVLECHNVKFGTVQFISQANPPAAVITAAA